ncbi:MAG: HigA family addiction module antitoxin [Opitutaceae bacterium]|jgi:addiction module HigA family antidote
MKTLTPITSGEILREDFLKPMEITAYRLAKDIHVPLTRITAILQGKRGITADTGLRLDRYFGLSEGYWMRIQLECDLREAKQRLGKQIADIKPRALAAA